MKIWLKVTGLSVMVLMFSMMSFMFFAPGAFALTVRTEEHYTTGAPAVIMIADDAPANPEDYDITLQKPDGRSASLAARREPWNAPGECFNVYTVERDGEFQVTVKNKVSGAVASARFSSSMFSRGSGTLYVISMLLLAICMGWWFIKIRRSPERP